jgi:hypothetical protein
LDKFDISDGNDLKKQNKLDEINNVSEYLDIDSNLLRLSREIRGICNLKGIVIPQSELIYPTIKNDELQEVNLYKTEIQNELKRESRKYLRDKYLTKVISIRKSIQVKLSIDSELRDEKNNYVVIDQLRTNTIFHSIDSVIDSTREINNNLSYSVGCHVKSSPLLKGDIEQSMEPVLKVKYKGVYIKTKIKPTVGDYEISIEREIPIKFLKKNLEVSCSTLNLRNVEWDILCPLSTDNFFYLGGDVPVMGVDAGGDALDNQVHAGFSFNF